MADQFDDTRLDDPDALYAADGLLRHLAGSGARLRIEAEAAEGPLAAVQVERPRAVLAVGPEARLLRAVLEPWCPIPFVAWPSTTLPQWVGTLDLVVVLGHGEPARDEALHETVHEARRRGARIMIACPPDAQIAECASSPSTTLLPTTTGDELASAVVMLQALAKAGVGPAVDPVLVADAMDLVAEECSPFRDISTNPAKEFALVAADALPLVWGGSVLAARASRRVAEQVRAASGRATLAADAGELRTVLAGVPRRDLFADPFESPADNRPALMMLDDGDESEGVLGDARSLERAAEAADVRIWRSVQGRGSVMERYAALLQTGRFGAAYLGIALGRELPTLD
mgnify:FL=1